MKAKRKKVNQRTTDTQRRLQEQRTFIREKYKIDPDKPAQVKNCTAEGFADSMEVYEYYKSVLRGQKRGKI